MSDKVWTLGTDPLPGQDLARDLEQLAWLLDRDCVCGLDLHEQHLLHASAAALRSLQADAKRWQFVRTRFSDDCGIYVKGGWMAIAYGSPDETDSTIDAAIAAATP